MTTRAETITNIEQLFKKSSENSSTSINPALHIGNANGLEVLLPKYDISTGRNGDIDSISQARIYLEKTESWNKDDIIPGADLDGKAYVGFLLSSVQESRQEKVQTLPLNGDNYVATFYGESPAIYSFGGILYNTHYARWRDLFSRLYDKAFRGSAVAKHRKLLHLVYDNKIISGWMISLSQSLNASNDTMANFNFNFLVRSEVLLGELSELAYNNAYFTGAVVDQNKVDTLADLPDSDSYINSARVRNPPTVQRGVSGKGKRAGCRPGAVKKKRNGRLKKTNPRKTGQTVSNTSPTKSSCDVAEAALGVISDRDKDLDKAKKAYEKKIKGSSVSDKQKAAALKSYRKTKQRIKTEAREELKTTWTDLKDPSTITDDRARRRANVLKKHIKTREHKTLRISVAADTEELEFHTLHESNAFNAKELKAELKAVDKEFDSAKDAKAAP